MSGKAKYAVYGGSVLAADGDVHYIPAHEVARLYRVNPKECIFISEDRRPLGLTDKGLVPLHPQPDGDYTLPEVEQLKPMNTATVFADELDKEPDNWELRSIYADWLEESGEYQLSELQRYMVANKKRPTFMVRNSVSTHPDRLWQWWSNVTNDPSSLKPLAKHYDEANGKGEWAQETRASAELCLLRTLIHAGIIK